MAIEEGANRGQPAADAARQQKLAEQKAARESALMVQVGSRLFPSQPEPAASGLAEPSAKGNAYAVTHAARNASGLQRSEERRVGKECGSKWRSRGAPEH